MTTTHAADLPVRADAGGAGSPSPHGSWYSRITFPDGSVQRSIVLYGRDGSLTESSTRYPTRLAGMGQWRPTTLGQFEAFFEKFLFPPEQTHPSALVRVEYTGILDETANEYTATALGVFMTLDREVLNSARTSVTAQRLPWTL